MRHVALSFCVRSYEDNYLTNKMLFDYRKLSFCKTAEYCTFLSTMFVGIALRFPETANICVQSGM